jgi:selenide,water dikinase
MCRASSVGARIDTALVPVLDGAQELAEAGIGTGAAIRNWDSYGGDVTLPPGLPDWRKGLLCDPQTSGGLLIATTEACAPALLGQIMAAGFARAAVIGRMAAELRGIAVV